ncbi:MAG: NAD(+)/NADH kinase [Candidatus Thorarchaeota archaeon]|nr:NAD(+)/NADH kinase [Candidatus Thorarchaeota archaeon]
MRVGIASGQASAMVEDATQVAQLLTDAGVEVELEEGLAAAVGSTGTPLRKMSVDVLAVVGSDHTLLNTLLRLGKRSSPVLPVASRGQPGFLFDVSAASFEEAVEDLVARRWSIERRARLHITMDGAESPLILNEIAIFPRTSAILIGYSLHLEGEPFWKDMSDGLIISTPTGSTAYAMSVGGPVVVSPAPVMTVIAVNSANPARRPLIVPDSMTLEVKDISSRVTVDVIFDGQVRRPLRGKSIQVTRSTNDALFVKFPEERVAALHGKLLKKIEVFESVAQDLPPSAKLVLKVLEYGEQLSQREIIEETKLPARTVRHALSILISEGLVMKKLSLRDSRQGLFRLTNPRKKDEPAPDTRK